MKTMTVATLMMIASLGYSQNDLDLKKRYHGEYEGIIPAYSMQSNGELHYVSSTPITIVIGENQVQVRVGNNSMLGMYEVMFQADKYYLLDVDIEGQLANERIMVYKRGKRLSRDGMFPQPVATLEKKKTGFFGLFNR
jgi:hypothetical protein